MSKRSLSWLALVLAVVGFLGILVGEPDSVGASPPKATTQEGQSDASNKEGSSKGKGSQDADAQQGDSAEAEAAEQEAAGTGDPQADTEEVLKKVGEEAKQTATEAVDALKEGDLQTAVSRSGELLAKFAVPAITVLLVLLISYFVASFLSRIASAPLRKRVDETLGRFVKKLVFYLIMVSAVLGVLQYFGIGVTSFAAVIAAGGFAVGLAFQGTLSNFAAGIMLLVFRPFKVGDVINAAGITAKVFEIDLFSTLFDTPDNRRIIVPNSEIIGGTIENITFHPERRVDVNVGVEYAADLVKTRAALVAAAESLREKLIDGDGRGYQIVLGDLGDSAVGWTVRFWTTAADYWTVKEALTAAVKNHLDQAAIGIPYPTLDVNVHQAG